MIVPIIPMLIGFYILTFIIGKHLLLVVTGVAVIVVIIFCCMTVNSIQAFKNAKKRHTKNAHPFSNPTTK